MLWYVNCLSRLLCCNKPSQHLAASDTYNNTNLSLLMIPWVVWGWDGWFFFWPHLGPVLSSLHWELSCESDAKGSKHLVSPGSLSTRWLHSSPLNITGSLWFSYSGSTSRMQRKTWPGLVMATFRLAEHHFRHMLSAKTSHKAGLASKGGETDATPCEEKWPSFVCHS